MFEGLTRVLLRISQHSYYLLHILDAELKIEGFTALRSDRLDRKGGGTMLYVKDFLMPEDQTKLINSGFKESAGAL